MAAAALLDQLRHRGTLEGGRSVSEPWRWIRYDRKGVVDEEFPPVDAATRGGSPPTKRRVVTEVTWAQAAAHGKTLPTALRSELEQLQSTELLEHRSWFDFSHERGGYPHRRRFDSDAEHQVAEVEWGDAWHRHLAVLDEVSDRRKPALERALPLTVDDEPSDLLELLDHRPAESATPSSVLQAVVLTGPTRSRPDAAPHDGRTALPSVDQGIDF